MLGGIPWEKKANEVTDNGAAMKIKENHPIEITTIIGSGGMIRKSRKESLTSDAQIAPAKKTKRRSNRP